MMLDEKHKPSADELQLMTARGFRFNKVGAYQMDLADNWAIIVSPYKKKRGGIFWRAKLDHRSIVRRQFGNYRCPIDIADMALAAWRKWVQAK